MEKRFQSLRVYLLLTVAFAIPSPGCSSPANNKSIPAQSYPQLKVLGILSGRYISENNGRPPNGREDLIAFLESIPQEWQGLGMESVDEFLTSPRDGEPLVLVVGKQFGPTSPSGLPWVAYEQKGIDGKFLAISARGGVTEMSEAELSEIFPKS